MPLLAGGERTALLGYCTNVEPTGDLAALERAIDGPWSEVRARAGLERPLGLGLWLPAPLAAALAESPERARALRERLAGRGLFCFTLNAFPFRVFHDAVVKHAVYRPSWLEPERAAYTLDAARALARLLPPSIARGTISTVPLGWRADLRSSGPAGPDAGDLDRCADALIAVALDLARLERAEGKRIEVLLEPEPGCALESTAQAIAFFARVVERADARGARATALRHLGVCFDVCHQAVLGERPRASLRALHEASVPVGKVHLSSAIEGPIEALARYAEPRYLHQTFAVGAEVGPATGPAGRPATACGSAPGAPRADDLPEALADPAFAGRRARSHFHVPIFASTLPGGLRTTADDLGPVLDEVLDWPVVPHLEVETYTWDVLPDPPAERAEGIAREIDHARALLAARGLR